MKIFLYCWTKIYIHFMLQMAELVRYYLLTILNKKVCFEQDKAKGIVA